MGLKVWSLLLSVLTLNSYSHSLLSVPQSLLSFADLARRQFCLSVVNLCLSIVNLCTSLSTFAFRPQRPSSSSPPSLRFNLSISSLRFGYLWICGSVLWVFVLWMCGSILWVCRSSLWVCRSVDFVLQESNHWSLIFVLLIFVDFGSSVFVTIYFGRNQLRPPPTRVRSDSTGGFSRSAAGLEFLHPIWSGRLRVGHKPDPDRPVDSPRSRNSAQLHPLNKWLLPMLPNSTKTSFYTQDGCGKPYQPLKDLDMER